MPRPEAIPIIDHIAAEMKKGRPDTALTIVGHTDAIGSNAYNVALSRRCAGTAAGAPCRLSASTARGIATESASESLELKGDERSGFSGRLGVKGALTFPLTVTAATN